MLKSQSVLTWLEPAAGERVPNVSLVTDADGDMAPHATVGIDTTDAGTGVLALAVDAGPVLGAVGVDDTLRPAVGRSADHLPQAGTLAPVADGPRRVAVGTAGVRLARVRDDRLHRG